MSRSDLIRQRHRSVQPRATAGASDVQPADDNKRSDVPQPSAENFAMRVRETLMVMLGRQGDPLDRGITLRDLIDSGVVTLNPGFSLGTGGAIPIGPGGGASSSVKPDLTPPPTVTHFQCIPSLTNIFFQTDDPTWAMGHGYFVTNIYGAQQPPGQPPPTFDKAAPIFSFTGSIGSWATSPNTTWHLWAKWETRDGVESISPAGGTNGISVTTGQDVDKLVAAMTGPGEPFKVVTVQTTLPDGSVVPPGTYTADAYIHSGEITNAKIANLAVDNAKIANLAVSKLTAGAITAAFIQSPNYNGSSLGWYIDVNGIANFQQAVIRGTVYATAGVFAGSLQAATGSFAGDLLAGKGYFRGGVLGGAYSGWGWPLAGQGGGFFLGLSDQNNNNSIGGLLLGNANEGHYCYLDTNGTFQAPGLTISGGSATFSGTIQIDAGSGTRLVINSQRIEVWEGATLRVRLGIW